MLSLLLIMIGCTGDHGALSGQWVAAFYRSSSQPDLVPDELEPTTKAADTGSGDSGSGDSGSGDSGQGGDAEVLPACEGDIGAENFRAWLRIDETQPVSGVHLSLYPDGPEEERPEASNATTPTSAMAGLVTGSWQDGQVQLDLVPDLDHAMATEQDRDAWREHHLRIHSQVWGDRCWTANWAWVDLDGQADPVEQGVVFMRRQ